MSTFRVKLVQGNQSNLDTAVTSGVSAQRTMYVAGPNRIPRLLNDGETFTDSNYWKRFAYPQMSLDQAFIQVVSDDGSVWNDNVPADATYPLAYDKANADVIVNGTTFTDANNIIDVLGDTGSYAVYTQITTNHDIRVRLNGDASAVFDVLSTTVQVFNPGDFSITSLEFANSSGSNATVNVLFSIRVLSNS